MTRSRRLPLVPKSMVRTTPGRLICRAGAASAGPPRDGPCPAACLAAGARRPGLPAANRAPACRVRRGEARARDALAVYCHHGVRSLAGAALLERLGHRDVRSRAGGIEAWSREVDPTVPRY